jgi:class 3 adenylate cyclase
MITTLFADVRGFAPLATRGEPEAAVATINDIFERVAELIDQESGVVNRVLGHGLLSVFDALEEHPAAAARAALEVRNMLENPAAAPRRRHREVRAGFGLNTGTVVAGWIGTATDAAYTVVGHAVTVASRLGAAAAPGQILMGAGTAALLSSEFDVRDRGTLDLAGLGPMAVFELVR